MYESNEGSLGQECTLMILLLNILLHYLYLTNFFWMFVEGEYTNITTLRLKLEPFTTLVKVFSFLTNKEMKFIPLQSTTINSHNKIKNMS